jgi:hypothetical protein
MTLSPDPVSARWSRCDTLVHRLSARQCFFERFTASIDEMVLQSGAPWLFCVQLV